MNDYLYTFVIVDDESEIREGIRDTIPWEKLGFAFKGAFSNGKEALEYIELNPPDVLITDINMPFMDGLVLSELVLQRSPGTKVLIISGYDDFEYARKALQLQVHDYIVKPITPSEFKDILRRLKEMLDMERAEEQDIKRLKLQLAENLPLIKERFLNQLITGIISDDELFERCKYLGLSIESHTEAFHSIVLDFIRHHGGEAFDIDVLRVKNVIRHHLENCINQSIITGWEIFSDDKNRLVLLIWGIGKLLLYQEDLKLAEQIYSQLLTLQLPPFGIAVGEVVTDLHVLPKAFQDTVQALQIGQLHGKQGIITYKELGRTENVYKNINPDWPHQIGNAIKTANMAKVYEAIDGMIVYLKNNNFSLEQYQVLIERLAAVMVITFNELDINEQELFIKGSNPFLELSRIKTLDELRSCCSAVAESCIAIIRSRQKNFAELKVMEALAYIQQNYSNAELSIQNLCKDLYISTSYFSAIIKNYTGKTFLELLTETRINKAKELLRTTYLKTSEIAEMVGYQDAHYFSISFKKITGKSPSEFRSEYE
ncbi:response regulator [Gracilinema caldarium]|uniref:Two component transcriptional regulator, AraC family n=1 Tax=Gracilinema caldarium (strain ATCC 51460 / DSM 7334 / H1) TaxID=744872 RepID=F8F0Y3_GRAC1|nr:response regulator [Gracilinema caldarium]AEJ20269.1 two component transcriptional regulator, AraC family [Gracilinema caldarium DSM 7334]